MLWWRGRSACLPRRRGTRHPPGAAPSVRRRALGLWHGTCRSARTAPQRCRTGARRGLACRCYGPRRNACRRGARHARTRTGRGRRDHDQPRAAALCRHRYRARRGVRIDRGDAGRIRGRAPPALRLRYARTRSLHRKHRSRGRAGGSARRQHAIGAPRGGRVCPRRGARVLVEPRRFA